MNGEKFHQHLLSESVLHLKNRQGWAVINSKWLDSGRLTEEKKSSIKISFGITIIYIYIYIHTTTAIEFIQRNIEQGGSVYLIFNFFY